MTNPSPGWTPTQHRSVRIPDDTWHYFGEASAKCGGRASVTRRLVHLYLNDERLRARVAALPDDLARDANAVAAAHG